MGNQGLNGSALKQVLALSIVLAVLGWWFFNSPWFFLTIPILPALFWRPNGKEKHPVRTCPSCGFETCDPSVHQCPEHKEPLTEVGNQGSHEPL